MEKVVDGDVVHGNISGRWCSDGIIELAVQFPGWEYARFMIVHIDDLEKVIKDLRDQENKAP